MIKKKYKTIFACMFGAYLFIGIPCFAYAQQGNQERTQQTSSKKNIQGIVKDEKGEPLIGVSVIVKGSTTGVMTDFDGAYTIPCDSKDILQFSYIGFQTQEIVVGDKSSVNVTLSEDSKILDEVIVIGYGTTTRKSVVGAVDQVGAKMIADRPVANASQALQGASPSLNIQQRSMNPNDNTMNINIRGISTMNVNSPLIVIDGLISESGSLNKLNPADIESVSVLKDAGTSAIYGSRSSNGILLVTTKKGKKNQRPLVRLGAQVGAQDPKVLFKPVSGYQNATLKNLALTNVGQNPEFSPAQIRDLYEHRSEEKWNYDEILRTALQQNYDVNVSGGSEHTTYMFSGAFYDQESNFVGQNFGIKRYNLRSNIVTEYGRFKFTSILAYTRNNSKATTAGSAIVNSSRIPPYYYYRMQANNGKYLVNGALTDQNPLGELRKGGYETKDNDYVNINLGLDVKIVDGLKLKGVFGADVYADHRYIWRKQVPLYSNADAEVSTVSANPKGGTEDFNEKAYLLNYQLMLDYNKTFGDHNVYGLFGATNESYTRRKNEIKYDYSDPILGLPTDQSVYKDSYASNKETRETSITSNIGRLGYSYADRYYAEASYRIDWSSIFSKERRRGFFPSGSLGWRISEESFMDFYKSKVGDFKLRASYGLLGNQDIDPYLFLTQYKSNTNTYGFNNSSVNGSGFVYGIQNLSWETTHTFNIGFDATFFNNSLVATVDYFHKDTKKILVTPEIPSVFGTKIEKENAGQMTNQGWEVTLNYRLKTGDFNHNFSGNLGDNWNKVTKYIGDEQISTNDKMQRITRVGLPYGAYYGYKTDGYFQSMEEIETSALPVGINASDLRPGDVKYVDRNGDGLIDAKDRYVLGTAFPRLTFGFSYEVQYKGFDFSMFLQGVGKRDMMVRGELVEPFHENYSYAIYKHQLDYWTPTNTDSKWPRLTAAGATSTQNNYGYSSDLFLFDGKYLRLKNIQLGYTLPSQIIDKVGVQKVRVYINAQNLFTLSKNSWIDPESSEFDSNMSGSANSARNYPTLKYYGFGVNVEF